MTNISLGYQKSLLVTEIQLCLLVINIKRPKRPEFFSVINNHYRWTEFYFAYRYRWRKIFLVTANQILIQVLIKIFYYNFFYPIRCFIYFVLLFFA